MLCKVYTMSNLYLAYVVHVVDDIRANCSEAEFAQSRADFLSKYTIALKEASETRYWIQLMIDNNLASEAKFTLMLDELNQIIKILISTTKKLKEK